MKFYDISLVIIVTMFVLTVVAAGISYKVLGPDSPLTKDIEEAAEKEGEAIIINETGIDVTPSTPQPQVQNAVNQ